MKATYKNPPYYNETIIKLEEYFLQAAIKYAVTEGTLKAIYDEACRTQDPCCDWHKIHGLSRYAAIVRTHCSYNEHRLACFVLE